VIYETKYRPPVICGSWLVPNFLTGLVEEDPLVQIVVDSTRNILYTRSEKGTLGVYDLGANGEVTEKVTSMSAQVIRPSA
jgi:nuclear pore complex protein Nup155